MVRTVALLLAFAAAPVRVAGTAAAGPAAAGLAASGPATAGPAAAGTVHASVRAYPLAEAPAELRPALQKAEGAAALLQKKLGARLGEAMQAGGPTAAVDACSADAARLAAEAAQESGVKVGRTSLRLRSAANGAPAWATPFLASSAGKKASEVAPVAVELGEGRLGLLKPIAVGAACLRCHGGPEAVPAEVRERLAARYPQDRATGFAEGDLRGFFWAEVK